MFRVGVSHDLRGWGDIGLGRLAGAGVEGGVDCEFIPPDDGTLTPAHVDGMDAVIFAAPAVTAATVAGGRPPLLLARFGVGLDTVDLAACTRSGVAVTITPDGAGRAVATATLTLILAAAHQLLGKDRLVRESRWDDKLALMGRGLTGRRVGAVGYGNVATELFRLLEPFGTSNFAADPYRAPNGQATLIELDELLRTCDIVVITAALTPQTRGLIDRRRIELMRPGAIFVNVARGPIVDTEALTSALASGRIFAAGLDVTDPEPLPPDHPLLTLPNVVLSPHALAWTDEMALGNGASCVDSVLAVLDGRQPAYLANPDVAGHARFGAWRTGAPR
jgi:phosphoglycerate dehydrogenase-like enzyme